MLSIATRAEAERTRVIIQDGGPGVPPGQTEAIFRPFHRVDDAITEGVAGTGIGLGLARDLARLHGGDLVLLPSERGARFEVTLMTPAAA